MHLSRGLAASWALFRGVSQQEICAAASWSSPLSFVHFYMLNISTLCVAHAVLMFGLGAESPMWDGGQEISLSGNSEATTTHSETSSEIL